MSTVEQAIELACRVHADQLDLAGEPYILHVLRVVTTLQFHDGHDAQFRRDARIVAALHDTVEDIGEGEGLHHLAAMVRSSYSPKVISAVAILTRDKAESYNEYVDRIAGYELTAVVKIADLRDNLQSWRAPLNEDPAKTERRREKYRAALARLSDIPGAEVERINFAE